MARAITAVDVIRGSNTVSSRLRRIGQLLWAKGLPRAQWQGVWRGPGKLSRCEACGELIEEGEIEYEFLYRQGDQTARIKLHLECWAHARR